MFAAQSQCGSYQSSRKTLKLKMVSNGSEWSLNTKKSSIPADFPPLTRRRGSQISPLTSICKLSATRADSQISNDWKKRNHWVTWEEHFLLFWSVPKPDCHSNQICSINITDVFWAPILHQASCGEPAVPGLIWRWEILGARWSCLRHTRKQMVLI